MNIGIAGVGGIGSNVAATMVRSGVDCLTLVDFDRVEGSNLNRQFYFADQIGRLKVEALAENLQRILPGMQIEARAERIDQHNCVTLFSECELIVEGLDRTEDKKMLIETLGDKQLVVSACGIAGSDLDQIGTRRLGNCTIFGDFATDCAAAPLFAHKVGTVANYLSAHILRFLETSHGTTTSQADLPGRHLWHHR
ncbi:MAG: sulfur carrier protein ThiS adenylyltransferase ThiF [Desulfobulbus sp.]|jgi:sulfur carrier protein ThiS adenylyltransferase|nr:sulfur carrier protein ThiS adenylyltransferase ThiF [Desulfobulbus sp.]